MIRLHPLPDPFHTCPHCGVELRVQGWLIPGMRTLADLSCDQCGRQYYGDLLAGHALYVPALIDKASGEVYHPYTATWWARNLRGAYHTRSSSPLAFTVEEFRPLKKVLLLNCIDYKYGHLLWKLLNVQYYLDHCPEYDVVVLVPASLRWLVPEGVAAIWTVGLSLRQGWGWSDWLAAELHRRLDGFDEVMLSVAYSHPHSDDYDVSRFAQVAPFDLQGWQAAPSAPLITFVWREDRRWEGDGGRSFFQRVYRQVMQRWLGALGVARQRAKVIHLAELLRRQLPGLTFAVTGQAKATGFPAWIQDLRTVQIDEATERAWLQHYARTHVLIGVHGSNMQFPSAYAATTIVLMPQDRLANAAQDLTITEKDARMALLRYRMIPLGTNVSEVAALARSLIERFHAYRLYFAHENLDHRPERFAQIPLVLRRSASPPPNA